MELGNPAFMLVSGLLLYGGIQAQKVRLEAEGHIIIQKGRKKSDIT